MEEGTSEGGGVLVPEEVRIHRLESLVRSLQMENKRLLTCVDGNKSAVPSSATIGRRSDSGPQQELVDLAREEEGENGEKDMWYVGVELMASSIPSQTLHCRTSISSVGACSV